MTNEPSPSIDPWLLPLPPRSPAKLGEEFAAAMADWETTVFLASAMTDRATRTLLAHVAELMHCIGEFWGAMHYDVGQSQIDRLFGFPVRRYDEGSWRERAKAFMSHYRGMADSSQEAYRRASWRLDREYGPRQKACSDIWLPVFEYVLSHDLAGILPMGWSVRAATCLPPACSPSPSGGSHDQR